MAMSRLLLTATATATSNLMTGQTQRAKVEEQQNNKESTTKVFRKKTTTGATVTHIRPEYRIKEIVCFFCVAFDFLTSELRTKKRRISVVIH